jgi:methylenetetrahydrofolate dehydrogenase (NADP+)/methenyltetrahydrofolate cyclohydrolase
MAIAHDISFQKRRTAMTAKLIKGTEIREEILAEIDQKVKKIKEDHGVVPGLVTILVGENPASISYVTLKIKTADRLGFKEIQDNQPETISEADLLTLIDKYNKDDSIHGILVQLPLPKHVDEKKILNAIDPDKDVDGFHPVNVGRLMIGGSEVKFPPCTPAGIQEMIVRSGVETSGAEVVVVGRSNIVGKPIANMMLQKGPGANATVTVVHTRTKDLAFHCKRADILIVAAGVPGLVKPEWIKPGACVIDVGVNRVGEKISEKTGKKVAILRGDVDFDAALEIAGYITPVPGGVGPMTITMLMKNTLNSLKFRLGIA